MSSEPKLDCVLCKDVFDSKEELKVHFRKHGDPNFNQKSNKTEMSGEKPSENLEMVACDVCPEVFTTISKAITHKHKVHPDHDAKYFCPWCGKLFTMKHLYNKHMKSNHNGNEIPDGKKFHCDVCDVDFYVPSAMTYHNKFFHRQDVDIPDIGHSKKLKLYNQELVPIFYCAFCGEEYENKVNLTLHVTDDHGDENQSPDEVLRCPLCDAIFYHLDAYEIHLTFHSTEDMFSVVNEMFPGLEEFSLESVPPVVEKVESLNPPDTEEAAEAESTLNTMGIDKFLEIAMDTSQDRVKPKKHKKHKKSKNHTITLDEFLNMNKDVFGEGLDFQGIEEVPTRAVAKRLKTFKKPASSKTDTLKDLAKLKKQGIVIKKKADVIQPAQSMKILKGQLTKPIKFSKDYTVNKLMPDSAISTSEDFLSKLISQSNNSLKIIKKSSNPENTKRVLEDNVIPVSLDNKDVPRNTKTNDDEPALDSEPANKEKNDITNVSNSNSQGFHLMPSGSPISKDDTEQISDMSFDSEPVVTDEVSTGKDNFTPAAKLEKMQNSLESLNNLQKKGIIVIKPPRSSDNDRNMITNQIENTQTEHCEQNSKTENDANNGVDIEHTENINELEEHKVSSPSEPLLALKGLSHLITVKPVNKVKSPMPFENENESHKFQSPPPVNTKIPIPLPPPVEKKINTIHHKPATDKDPTLDTLKTLSKAITVKSVSQHHKSKMDDNENDSDDNSDLEHDDSNHETKTKSLVVNQNINIKNSLLEKNESNVANIINSPNRKPTLSNPIPKVATECSAQNINANILKRLPNITTKQIVNKKPEHVAAKPTIMPQKVNSDINDGDIEIFNIDDSDDEDDNATSSVMPQHTPKSSETPKTLNKNISIKSVHQKPVQKIIKSETTYTKFEEEHFEDDNGHFTDYSDDDNISTEKSNYVNSKICSQKLSNKKITINNALKNLGKNIIIKSRNPSPNQSVKSLDHNTQDSNPDYDEAASDSDSCPGNVKITEINEPASDDEINPESDGPHSSNAVVQSPDDSFSDNENEDIDDLEKEIKANTLQKSPQNEISNPAILNTLKNIGKNITIKSVNDQTEREEKLPSSQEIPEIPDHLQKQLAIKPYKRPTTKDYHNKNVNLPHSPNQSVNQKMEATTSNQVNTVNKEVTVKTFQTKTVIQEITTTVTKTIKTVNQTMKQEIRNCNQTSTPMATQRNQSIRPNQVKNLQGTIVRHAQPTGSRIATPQMRPPGPVVRPSRNIVPIRTNLNTARLSTPRMPSVRKCAPNPSPQKPAMGKPLKISPGAMNSSNALVKRTRPDETSGPFSCFKKPKESLIPMADMSNLGGGQSAQFASTSQMSTSNFSSTTKVVKGNSIVTSTQTKSEMSASAQQIKLSNTGGIKIVKSSQVQQMQTQEKSETNSMKRTTLAAIEKLQKQGLLVKKPRLDANEDSDNSQQEGNDNLEYSSSEERDE